MNCLLVSGSRWGKWTPELSKALAPHLEWAELVIHGAARGVDSVVSSLLEGKSELPVPAQWNIHSNAGPRRNAAMVSIAETLSVFGWTVRVLCLPGPNSKGTWDLKRKADDAGLEIICIEGVVHE